MPDIFLAIGILGALFVLIGFVLNQTHKIKDTDLSYDVINFIGSASLVVYAAALASYPFIILNFVWVAVSLRDVIAKKTKR